jgi:chromosome segregation ATPase
MGRSTQIHIFTALLLAMGLVGCGDDEATKAEQRAAELARADRQRAIEQLQREVADLKDAAEQTEKQLEQRKQELREAERNEPMVSLSARAQQLSADVETMTDELTVLKKTLETMQAMTDQAVREQPEVREALDRDVSLQTLEAMLTGQERQLEQAEQRGASSKDIAALKKRIAATQDEYNRKRAAVTMGIWQRKLDEHARSIATLEQQLQELTSKRKAAQEALDEERKPLAERIDAQRQTLRTLTDKIARLQARIRNIEEGGPLTSADRLGTTDPSPKPQPSPED